MRGARTPLFNLDRVGGVEVRGRPPAEPIAPTPYEDPLIFEYRLDNIFQECFVNNNLSRDPALDSFWLAWALTWPQLLLVEKTSTQLNVLRNRYAVTC